MRSSYRPSFISATNEEIGGKRYTVKEIQRERRLEKLKKKMIEEFKEIDENMDKDITLSKWMHFLKEQVLNTNTNRRKDNHLMRMKLKRDLMIMIMIKMEL